MPPCCTRRFWRRAEKAEEVDDSSGSFGQFAAGVIWGWIAARPESGSDPAQTARRLLAWIDDDPYGFCYRIEKDVARALNPDGIAAFERQVRSRFDAAVAGLATRNRWSEVLRTLYVEQNNVAAYVELTRQTALTAQDCHAIARMLAGTGMPDEALAWVERGIALERQNSQWSWAGGDLKKLQRELLASLGRGREALESAWTEFQARPSKYAYDDLVERVPGADRPAWKEKARSSWSGRANSGATPAMPISPAKSSPRGSTWRR